MNTYVIYDSYFGNTKIIAETIAKELGNGTKISSVKDFDINEIDKVDLLVLGSPIRGWKPTENIENFLNSLKNLEKINAATFDTRVRIFFHGDAAKAMSKKLKELGAEIIIPPQFFEVKGKEGPLFEGEIEKAVKWAKLIKNAYGI